MDIIFNIYKNDEIINSKNATFIYNQKNRPETSNIKDWLYFCLDEQKRYYFNFKDFKYVLISDINKTANINELHDCIVSKTQKIIHILDVNDKKIIFEKAYKWLKQYEDNEFHMMIKCEKNGL